MTATNMCSNFGSKWSSPPLRCVAPLAVCLGTSRTKLAKEPEAKSRLNNHVSHGRKLLRHRGSRQTLKNHVGYILKLFFSTDQSRE